MKVRVIVLVMILFVAAGCNSRVGYRVGYFEPVDASDRSATRQGALYRGVPNAQSKVGVEFRPAAYQVGPDKRVSASLDIKVVNNGAKAVQVKPEQARLKPAHDVSRQPVRVERVSRGAGGQVAPGATATWRLYFDLGHVSQLEGLETLELSIPLEIAGKTTSASVQLKRSYPHSYSSYSGHYYYPYHYRPYHGLYLGFPYYYGHYGYGYRRHHGHHGHRRH